MRIVCLLLVVTVLLGASFLLQTTVSAQTTTYITVYGQLAFSPCTSTSATPPTCQSFFYLVTNDSTPGIPNYVTLDFSQSIVPLPAQSDVGKKITVIGYYGQEPQCPVVNGCFAFFVYQWTLHFEPSTVPTAAGCFSSSNPPTTWYSVQCVTAPTIPLAGNSNTQTNLMSNPIIQIGIAVILVILSGYLYNRRKR